MAKLDDADSDDDLPPLVGSGGQPVNPTLAQKPVQAATAGNDDEDDEDDLPPLIGTDARKAATADDEDDDDELPPIIGGDARKAEIEDDEDELPPLVGNAQSGREKAPEFRPEPKEEKKPEEFRPEPKALGGGLGSGKKAGMIPASSPAQEAAAEPSDLVERIKGKDDLDDAIDVLEDGHAEEAELLAEDVRRQAAEDKNAEKEADALRIMTKARIESAKQKGRYGQHDSLELDRAMKSVRGEAAAFGQRGEYVAQAMMLLAQAEIHLAEELYAGAVEHAKDALELLSNEQALMNRLATNLRLAMAYRTLADIYGVQQRYYLVVLTVKKLLAILGDKPDTMAEAREAAAALTMLAKARVSNGEAGMGLKPAEQAALLCERMGDPRGSAIASVQEATAHLAKSGSHVLARRAAMRAVALSKEAGDIKIEAKAWHAAGLAYLSEENVDEAMKAQKQSLALAKEANDIDQIVKAIEGLMRIYVSVGQPDKSAMIAEEELMNSKKFSDRRREGYAQLQMAGAMIIQDRPREAVRRAEDGAAKLRQVGDRKGEAKAMQQLVELQAQTKRNVEAIRTARDAEKLLVEVGMVKNAANILHIVSSLHVSNGNGAEALKAALSQVKLYNEAGYQEEEAAAILDTLEVVTPVRGLREAQRLCKDAASLFKGMDDPMGESRALNALSATDIQLKAVTSALETAKRSDELARECGEAKAISSAQTALGEAYIASERFAEAMTCAKDIVSVIVNAKLNDDKALAQALTDASKVQIQVANYDGTHPGSRSRPRGIREAQKNAEEAASLWKKLGEKQKEADLLQRVFQVHLLAQDGSKALRSAREYHDLAQTMEEKYNIGSSLLCLCQANFLNQNFTEAIRKNEEAQIIFQRLNSKENVDVCRSVLTEIETEQTRKAHRSQPMGQAQSAQPRPGSCPDPRGQNSMQGNRQGVPGGGFGGSTRGVPAGGFSGSVASKSTSSSRPEKSSLDKGLAGLKGMFTKERESPRKTASATSANNNWGPTSSLGSNSSSSSAAAASKGGGFSSRFGSNSGSSAQGDPGSGGYPGSTSYGARSAGNFGSSSGQGAPASGSGASRGVPSGGFGGGSTGGRPSVPAGGFGGSGASRQGVPSGGFGGARQSVPAGGFGGSDRSQAAAPAPARPAGGGSNGSQPAAAAPSRGGGRQRSAFAAFAGGGPRADTSNME